MDIEEFIIKMTDEYYKSIEDYVRDCLPCKSLASELKRVIIYNPGSIEKFNRYISKEKELREELEDIVFLRRKIEVAELAFLLRTSLKDQRNLVFHKIEHDIGGFPPFSFYGSNENYCFYAIIDHSFWVYDNGPANSVLKIEVVLNNYITKEVNEYSFDGIANQIITRKIK